MKDLNSDMNNQIDELDQFLESLSENSSEPDPKFRENLKSQIMKESSKKNNLFNFNSMNKKLLAGALVFSFLLIFFLGGGTFILLNNRNTSDRSFDQDEVLANIASANASFLNGTGSAGSLNIKDSSAIIAENASAYAMRNSGNMIQDNDKSTVYKMTVSKFKVDLGPGANKCPAINADIYPSGSIQTTMWSYYDDTHYANKNVTKDNNNKIIQYGLSNDNKYIEYIGGQYAVEITYDYPEYNNLDDPNEDLQPLPEIDESNPSSDLHNINSTDSVEPSEGSIGSSEGTEASVPPVDLDDVKTPGSFWFGENEQVIETKDEYGRQVYKVTYDSTYYCNAYSPQSISSANKMMVVSSPEKNDLTKTKVVLLVDKDTYEILQTKTYLGEIADDNLLTTESSSFEYSNPDFADVKSIFAYDLEIPLKQYSYKYYSIKQTNEMLKDMILNENLNLLLPTDKSYDSYSLYSPSIENQPNFQNYIYNRDYYPDTDYGEKLYNNIAAYAPSLINDSILLQLYYSYSGDTSVSMDNSMPIDNGYKSYNISILESNISNKAIIKDLYKDYNNNGDSNGTDINLQIDEKSVSAKLYSLSTTQPQVTSLNTSKEEIDNGSIPMETDNNSYLVIFDFDNNKYVIVNSDYGTAQQDKFINELKFTSLKSTNPAQKSEIEKLVDSSYPKY